MLTIELAGIYIEGEGFIRVENEERFARVLEERLGQDAADMFRQLQAQGLDDFRDKCCGECDRLYEMQEEYERTIQEALELLDTVDPRFEDETQFRRAVELLEGVL